MRGDGEAHANNMEKWQDGRLLRHLGGSCGLRARLLRCLDGSKQQRNHRLPCGRALQRGRWLIPDGLNLEMKRFEIGGAILLTRSTSSIFASCIWCTRANCYETALNARQTSQTERRGQGFTSVLAN